MKKFSGFDFCMIALVLASANTVLCEEETIAAKPAAKSAGPKQYIYSRSNRPTSSSALGITGVPAYVNFPNGSQQCGVYIMQCSPGGAWSNMGLRPGRVLLTIDGRTAQSPGSVDSALAGKSGSIDYTYARISDGVPELIKSRVNYGGASSVGLGMALPPPGKAPTKYGNELVEDNTPIGQLESQMVGLINKDRGSNGLPSISDNSRLSDLARNYAQYLITHGGFSHEADGRDPLQRAKASGISGGIAENLAFESRIKPDKDSVIAAQRKFMNEPPNQKNHRGNILWTEARSVGVGIVRNKSTLMMVQEFSDGTP